MTDVCDRCHGLGWIGKARTPAPSMTVPALDEPPCPECGGKGRVASMTEDEATHRLGEALNHLHAFAATFNPGDYVDEESALTADDLNVILDVAEKIHAMAKAAPSL